MIRKRSLSIQGHPTSISIEDAFWTALKAMALGRDMPLPALVAAIDAERTDGTNLSSAIRLAVLADAAGTAAAATAPPARPVFSHIHLGVADLARAFAFWAPLAARLDLTLRFHEPARGWAGWQRAGADRPLFILGLPFDGRPAAPGNGGMTAFLAASRDAVAAVHAAALAAGAADEGAPGPRPHYHAGFYGAYFRDLDSDKICVCHHDGPEA